MLLWPNYLKRDYDAALAACQKTLKLYPDDWMAHWWSGVAYVMKGQLPAAFAQLERSRASNPDSNGSLASLAIAYARSGSRAKAEASLAELMNRRSKQYVSPMDIASVYHALGESDEMFRWLDKAYSDESELLIVLQYDPQWDDLRNDSRFRELVRKVQRDTSAEKI